MDRAGGQLVATNSCLRRSPPCCPSRG